MNTSNDAAAADNAEAVHADWPSTIDESHEYARRAMAEDQKRRKKVAHDADLLASFSAWVAAGRPIASSTTRRRSGQRLQPGEGRGMKGRQGTSDDRVRELIAARLGADASFDAPSRIVRDARESGFSLGLVRARQLLAEAQAALSPDVVAAARAAKAQAAEAKRAKRTTSTTTTDDGPESLRELMRFTPPSRKASSKAKPVKANAAAVEQARALAAKKAGRPAPKPSATPTKPVKAKPIEGMPPSIGKHLEFLNGDKPKGKARTSSSSKPLARAEVTPLPKKPRAKRSA